MADCLLRRSWAVHDVRSPSISAPIPMWTQLTGEPAAGEPHSGFGGRGRSSTLPTPLRLKNSDLEIVNPHAASEPDGNIPPGFRVAAWIREFQAQYPHR